MMGSPCHRFRVALNLSAGDTRSRLAVTQARSQAQTREKEEDVVGVSSNIQDGTSECPLPEAVMSVDSLNFVCKETEWCTADVWCDVVDLFGRPAGPSPVAQPTGRRS